MPSNHNDNKSLPRRGPGMKGHGPAPAEKPHDFGKSIKRLFGELKDFILS